MSADGYSFDSAPSAEELSRFDLNDYGNAMRFIRMAGGQIDADDQVELTDCRILYLRRRGWIAFNGRFWDLEQGEALARRHAAKVAQALFGQMAFKAKQYEDLGYSAKTIQGVRDFAVSAGNNGRISAMLAVAQSYLDVAIEEFDRDPLALNCKSGVIRFVRGKDDKPEIRYEKGHVARDRFTRMVEAEYDGSAAAPLFREVVDFALPDKDVRHYLHKALGYCATASTEEQAFFVFQGRGGDGKSTIVNAVRDTLGTYATVVGIETFLDSGVRKGSEASPDIAALAGDTRMLSAGEPPSGSKLATGAIKAFTGGGKMKARELREGLFEFTPIGKPIIECNRRPSINDTDDGIWRRLKIVLFNRQVPDDKKDGKLPQKLKAERDGILAWLCEGVLAWMAEGLKEPEGVKAAVEDYRKGSNPFAQWMEDRLVRDPDAISGASVLFKDYTQWMEDQGHDKPMSQKAFGAALGDQQIILAGKDGDGRMRRRGARLRTIAEAFSNASPPANNTGPSAGGSEGSERYPDDDIVWPEDGQ